MSPPLVVHAPSHTHDIFDPAVFPSVVDWVVREARGRYVEALAACGHSGLLVAGAAAYVLRIPVLAVRKDGDHAKGDGYRVNGAAPTDSTFGYAFVDDFVCSGDTFMTVVRNIRREIGPHARCRWMFSYQGRPMGDWARWYRSRQPARDANDEADLLMAERATPVNRI